MAHMIRPTALDVARRVRKRIEYRLTSRELIQELTGLSERQLRRRLDGEVPFMAHHYLAIIKNPLPRNPPEHKTDPATAATPSPGPE